MPSPTFAIPTLPASSLPPSDLQPQPEAPPLPYDPPSDSAPPSLPRHLEILKNGTIVEKISNISKAFLVVGRLPVCDIESEHASISRYHAILQFHRDGSCSLYDLDSTHGTWLNKVRVAGRHHTPVKIGDMIRFGASSRTYLLLGSGDEEMEEEPVRRVIRRTVEVVPPRGGDVSWGFGEDASEDDPPVHYTPNSDDEDIDPNNISLNNEDDDSSAYYTKDPKKSLRTYLEARSLDVKYTVTEEQWGKERGYVALIDVGEVGCTGRGESSRKRDAEREAALDALRKLDRMGVLRGQRGGAARSAEKRRMKELRDIDDAEEDDYYDRTAPPSRKKKPDSLTTTTETHASLVQKRLQLFSEIRTLEDELAKPESVQEEPEDEIEKVLFAMKVKEKARDKEGEKGRVAEMYKEMKRLDKLITLTAPRELKMGFVSTLTCTTPIAPATPVPIIPATPIPTAVIPPTPTVIVPAPVKKKAVTLGLAETISLMHQSSDPPPSSVKRRAASPLPSTTLPTIPPSTTTTSTEPTTSTTEGKRRRVYGVMSQAQVQAHEQVETEEAVDWLAPEVRGSSKDSNNAAYGY
ncbi:hypothetical protein DFS34DRAFT_498516 [Phlyctochytrium arcticum]|nr:hypothetical protein DFS34DRAFT_498516 [Phlyctochytrium arcticum]